MTFLEALRSDLQFKRIGWNNWWCWSAPMIDQDSGKQIEDAGWTSTTMSLAKGEPDGIDEWTRADFLANDFLLRA